MEWRGVQKGSLDCVAGVREGRDGELGRAQNSPFPFNARNAG